jgi:hypothetical protein
MFDFGKKLLFFITLAPILALSKENSSIDTLSIRRLNDLAFQNWYSNLDTVLVLASQQLQLASSIEDKIGIIKAHIDFWHVYNERQLFVEAIRAGVETLRCADDMKSNKYRAVAFSNLGLPTITSVSTPLL